MYKGEQIVPLFLFKKRNLFTQCSYNIMYRITNHTVMTRKQRRHIRRIANTYNVLKYSKAERIAMATQYLEKHQ